MKAPSKQLVTDGSSHQPQQYWKTTTKDGKDVVDRYERLDGKPYLEAVMRGKAVVELRLFDEKGRPLIVERLHPTKKDKRKRRIATRLTVHFGAEQHEVVCDAAGRISSITVHKGKTTKVLFDAKKLGKLDSPGCGRLLKASFGKLIHQSALMLSFDDCKLCRLELQSQKKYFKATAFTGDEGGSAAIAIDEGKHEGKVFFLDHEEGLFSLDCIDDVLEDDEIDPKKLSRDELIEAMPFFHNPLAPTRTDFLRGLSLRTNLTYYDELVRFAPVEKLSRPAPSAARRSR